MNIFTFLTWRKAFAPIGRGFCRRLKLASNSKSAPSWRSSAFRTNDCRIPCPFRTILSNRPPRLQWNSDLELKVTNVAGFRRWMGFSLAVTRPNGRGMLSRNPDVWTEKPTRYLWQLFWFPAIPSKTIPEMGNPIKFRFKINKNRDRRFNKTRAPPAILLLLK